MKIDLYLADQSRTVLKYRYDRDTSELFAPDGSRIFVHGLETDGTDRVAGKVARTATLDVPYIPPTPNQPGRKARGAFKTIKIQLGLACNYDCSYCLQATMPRTGSSPAEVANFVAGMDAWVGDPTQVDGSGITVELRGGEPFVYWKTFKPLAEAIRAKYPGVSLAVCTNGSLLDAEKNAWLDSMGFQVSISHDGPGQHVRGVDPFEVPEQREAILDLYARLAPKKRISINPMLNAQNANRGEIQRFIANAIGDPNVPVGEGTIIDAYDSSAVELSFDEVAAVGFRRQAFADIVGGRASNFATVALKVAGFVNSLALQTPIASVKQKCGMDRPDRIAVDMQGNVLTCHNVQASEFGIGGRSHKIGTVGNIDDVRLDTVRHWSSRAGCPTCPVLHLCGGSCMYLDDQMFATSCENSYSDNVVFMAVALKGLLGGTLIYVDAPGMPEHRKNIFGMAEVVDGHVKLVEGERVVLPESKKKRIIPIRQA